MRGTGRAPNGYRTWVAFRSETDREYYLASVAVDAVDANTWQSTKAIVGEAAAVHARFHFYAFNAPVSDDAKLTELSYGTPVKALPRHRGRVATVVVARNGTDTAPCTY
ncbi:hypothetical protein [Streptomyces odontomachi]|uniref:hypothetical protein n=1 Tax=Streptomyces odontomachi TaxID=2944940 RepID=UPI00210B0BA3|nr:hypothetical protein [Streptomyces sp. ODS25]